MEKRGSRYYAIDPRSGKKRSTHKKTLPGAMAVLAEWERGAVDPTYSDAASKTLADGAALVTRAKRMEGAAEGTQSMYEQKIAQLARLFGERRPLAAFTSEAIDKFVDTRLHEGVTKHTVHKELAVLRQILKHCKRRGWFRQEVEQVMPVGFSPDYKPETDFLPMEKWGLLLDGGWIDAHDGVSKHDAFVKWSDDRKRVCIEPMRKDRAAHVAFMIATGANLEESFRAKREHINVDGRAIYIDGTKRETRKRFVPINKINARLITRVLLDAPGKKGEPLFNRWDKMWRDLGDRCRKLGLPHLSSNDLRRTYGSILAQAGVPFEIIAKLMGHSSVNMVFKVYGQLRPTHVQDMVAQYIPEAK